MKRRVFIALSGAAATLGPSRLLAQQGASKRLGVLLYLSKDDPQAALYLAAFTEGLVARGWSEGRNLITQHWWGGDSADAARRIAMEAVAAAPDVIMTVATNPSVAAARLTSTIPIVFTLVSDPIAAGLVPSLATPGGNVTGFTNIDPAIGAKWLDYLRALLPTIRQAGFLTIPGNSPGNTWPAFRAAAMSAGIEPVEIAGVSLGEIMAAIAAFGAAPGRGVVVPLDTLFVANRAALVEAVTAARLPAVYGHVFFADAGAPLVYGIDPYVVMHQSGDYVAQILGGASPATMPVRSPGTYNLIVNLMTAAQSGLTIPPELILLANKVIE